MKLTDEETEQMLKVLKADTSNFIELIKIAGLNPKTDLMYANLSEVDFSDCDLRGLDLTGADLANATGDNVLWDETTVLNGADLTGSIFENGGGPHGRTH